MPGLLLTALAPHAGESALVVGAGTGYAAPFSPDGLEGGRARIVAKLVAARRDNGVSVVEGPLDDGHGHGRPYDLILIDGAVEYIPDALVEQLRDGGRLGGAIIEHGDHPPLRRPQGRRRRSASIRSPTSATPALPGFERPRAFTF